MCSLASRGLLALCILFPTAGLAATVCFEVPADAVPTLLEGCQRLAVINRSKVPTNPVCAAMLVRRGMKDLIGEVTRRQAQETAKATEKAWRDQLLIDFPSTFTPAVCGDNDIDAVTNEACDDGGSNSDTVADACRSNCQVAHCGDGVTDTGEVCDDGREENTCTLDCTGTIP